MDISTVYKLYLKANHLPENQTVGVTIEAVNLETLHPRPGQETKAIVLSFKNKNRRLVLNQGNANRLADIAGSTDTDSWLGLVVGLRRGKWGSKDTIQIVEPPKTNGNGSK